MRDCASGFIWMRAHARRNWPQRLASPLSKLLPPSAAEAKKLQKQLMQAGFRSASAPIIFRAIQLASHGRLSRYGRAWFARCWRDRSVARLFYILLAFVIGFFLPRYVLRQA